MWLPNVLASIMIYGLVVNLLGVAWGWYRKDLMQGWFVAVVGGSGVGLISLGVAFAVWILMGAPVN